MDINIYQRAEKFFPWNLQKTVLNSTIFPYWDKNYFYYFSQNASGALLKRVNSITGESEDILDCSSILEPLSLKLNEKVSFEQLPLDKFMVESNPLHLKFNYKSKLWLYDLKNMKLLDEIIENHNELISPNKAFALKTQSHNLFVEDTAFSRQFQLTNDGIPYYDYASSPETNTRTVSQRIENVSLPPIAIWSPDSTKIVTHKLDQRKVIPLNLLQNSPEGTQRPKVHEYRMSFSGDKDIPLAELIVIDIHTKLVTPVKVEPLLSPYLTPIEFLWVWWNDDSSKIYFLNETRSSKELILSVVNPKNGNTTILIKESAETTYVEPSQFFLWPRQTLILEDRKEIVWLSERSGYSHLYLYAMGNKNPKNAITSGEWCVRTLHFFDSKDNWLYFTASGHNRNYDPYYKFLFRCKLDGTELECITDEIANHTIQFSPDNSCFLDTYSTVDTAPTTVLKALNGKIITIIENADLTGLNDLNWVRPKRFKVKARDNITDIYGNLYFPSNFDPEKKYPLIDHIYPGPQVYRTPAHFNLYGLIFRSQWTAQALAELGFIVMHIDGLGTPGRSKVFHDATYQNMGDCGIPDHVTAIKQLASQYDFINLEKIGITGFSGGGYAAARAMLLYPDFYKVGVSAAGNHDLRCYPASYGEKYNSLDASTYEYQSNAALAENLKGKLLLIHGEMDDNVHPCATFQFVDALIKHNKNFDLLIMPNLNHRATFDHPYYVRRQWDYLIQHLLEQAPPYNEKHVLTEIPDTFPQLIDW